MRLRMFATAVLLIALAIAAASATGASQASPARAQADALTVWLMGDAQANWPEAVAAANQSFKSQHPGADVNVQYQSWGDYKTKFEATLSAGSGPDVIEFGNTDVPKYSAAGALAPLTRSDFPNSGTWLSGLTKAGSYNGKLYAVPYYAGARGVIYRTDQYKAAGVTKTPKTLAEFNAAMAKLMKQFGGSKNPTYSAVYFPGRYWYAAMSFVYDYGGQIATTKNGKWVGALNSPKALSGLTAWRNVARSFSRANKTGDEAHPQQALVFAKNKVGSFIGNGWEWPYALDPKLGNPSLSNKIGAYPMPSHTPGQVHADVPRRLEPRRAGDEQAEGARLGLDRRVHEHGEHDPDGRGRRRDPEHDQPREDQRREADAGAVRRGREVQLVRPLDPELGQRRERERAAEHAQRNPPQSLEDEGARNRSQRADHGDPERPLNPRS